MQQKNGMRKKENARADCSPRVSDSIRPDLLSFSHFSELHAESQIEILNKDDLTQMCRELGGSPGLATERETASVRQRRAYDPLAVDMEFVSGAIASCRRVP